MGHVVTFDLTPSEVLIVQGAPTLVLNDGGVGIYDAAASTSTDLVFRAKVAAGQSTTDFRVESIMLGTATIADQTGTPVDLTSIGMF